MAENVNFMKTDIFFMDYDNQNNNLQISCCTVFISNKQQSLKK